MKIAIIDLGTNTFNLLVADVLPDNKYEIIHNSKYAVKIGKGGINNKTIMPDAIERGLAGIERHLKTIREFGDCSVHAFATSAIRDAANGQEFANLIHGKYGINVNIIDGNKEAELIYDGVKQAVEFNGGMDIIVDIGGGSNELVIADKKGVKWQHSFNLGMARLLDQFQPVEPMNDKQIKLIWDYLNSEMTLFLDILSSHTLKRMIGSSGSFDTLAAILNNYTGNIGNSEKPVMNISLEQFQHLYQQILSTSVEKRKQIPGMDMSRIEMIGLACIFIDFVIKKAHITEIVQCNNSLKEGALLQIIEKRL